MKKLIIVSVLVSTIVYFGSCKKEDNNNPPPPIKKMYIKTKSFTHPIKPPLAYHYTYYGNWKIHSQVQIRENDTTQSIFYNYDNDKLSYKIIWDKNEASLDTVSFEYSGSTTLAYWHQNGVKHKVFLYELNDGGKPEYEEVYDKFSGELYRTTENKWQDGNLIESVYLYPNRNTKSITTYTYFSDVYNPDEDNYSFSFALSTNYISTIDGPSAVDDYVTEILEKVDDYPRKVEFGLNTIVYEYY